MDFPRYLDKICRQYRKSFGENENSVKHGLLHLQECRLDQRLQQQELLHFNQRNSLLSTKFGCIFFLFYGISSNVCLSDSPRPDAAFLVWLTRSISVCLGLSAVILTLVLLSQKANNLSIFICPDSCWWSIWISLLRIHWSFLQCSFGTIPVPFNIVEE